MLITSFQQAVANAINFQAVLNPVNHKSIAFERFGNFSHWYYIPSLKIFAPSKFIGYKNTTVQNYTGNGNGGQTTKRLDQFFVRADSKTFAKLLNKLEIQYHIPLGKKLHQKTINNEWIYLPKPEAVIDDEETNDSFENQVNIAINLSEDELVEKLKESETDAVDTAERTTKYFIRNPYVVAAALKIAKGRCGCCGVTGFKLPNNSNYLEVHHVVRLADGGVDKLSNAAAVCANCHREMHFGTKSAKENLIKKLLSNLSHLIINK